MEEIYLLFLELLKAVPELRWIDMDQGQLEQDRPPVAYPCALINIDYDDVDDKGANIQFCNTTVTIRVAFNYTGSVSAKTPDLLLERSLEYCRTINKVYKAIQGKTFKGSRMKRRGQIREPRPDGITVVQVPFQFTFLDQSAA